MTRNEHCEYIGEGARPSAYFTHHGWNAICKLTITKLELGQHSRPIPHKFHSVPWGAATLLFLEVSRSHSTTHHSRYDPSGRLISSSQGPVPDNTQRLQETNIQASGRIRTRNPKKRAAADPRLIPRCPSDWHNFNILQEIYIFKL